MKVGTLFFQEGRKIGFRVANPGELRPAVGDSSRARPWARRSDGRPDRGRDQRSGLLSDSQSVRRGHGCPSAASMSFLFHWRVVEGKGGVLPHGTPKVGATMAATVKRWN